MSKRTFQSRSLVLYLHAPISLEIKNEIVTEEQKLVQEFNSYYTNIVQSTSGRISSKLGAINPSLADNEMVKRIIDSYKKHPSIKLIKENFSQKGSFQFVNASVRDINKIIRNINPNKASDPYKVSLKLVKLLANVIDVHLTHILNCDISPNVFSYSAKIMSVRPILFKKDRANIENYKGVSILNCFSKTDKRFPYDQLTVYINKILAHLMAAYRKGYSTSHVLIRMIENWKKALNNSSFTGDVLTDLPKALDCILHDLLIVHLRLNG